MLKVCVLSDDYQSSAILIQLISKIKAFNFVNLSSDLIELSISGEMHRKTNVIIVDKLINESYIVKLTDMFSSVFGYVIYARNEIINELSQNANVAFLKSPYTAEAFKKIAKKFEEDMGSTLGVKHTHNFEDHFFIRCEKGKIRRINVDEVLFIEADQNYMNFHQQEESYAANFTLNGIEKVLPSDQFIRVHRSFIVNINKIRSIETNRVLINGDVYVPIGQSYRKKIFGFFSDRILG